MKKRRKSIICSVILAVTLFVTILIGTYSGKPLTIYAESLPDIVDSAEPTFAGYRIKDIKNWDAETDPYAEFLRATVPLQERNEPFAATQANPKLSPAAQVMLMQSDYGNNFFDSTMYTDEFSMLTMNFWQYVDFFCPWHGAATAYTPKGLYDQKFEFGIVNIPNPAYTNAAHKNGVKSIACIYLDPNFRPGQTIRDLTWEGIADKLIEMAEYYGYDGYFLNNEERIDSSMTESLIAMMKRLTEHGLWTQYYNLYSGPMLRSALDSFNAVFSQYGTHNTASSDKEWTNSQDWSKKGEYFEGDFNDKYFYGMECNQARFSQRHNSTYDSTINNLKKANASVALFEASTFYQRDIDSITEHLDNGRPASQTDAYQWLIEERERIFFSGGNQDPSNTEKVTKDNSEVVSKSDKVTWRGVADMIVERSVIDGSAFYTNFNTGHGMQYFKDGKVNSDHEWTNVNIQDIMPTWQWWVSGQTVPNVSYDYGPTLTSRTMSGDVKTWDYDPIGGYNGGSSLVVYGNIENNVVHLYKTALSVSKDTSAEISYRKNSNDDVVMYLDLIFEKGQNESVRIDGSEKRSDSWQTAKLDLGKYAESAYGKLEAVNLKFEGTASEYQMNVGGISITDGKCTPSAPAGFRIKNVYADGQLTVCWDEAEDMAANYNDGVVQYNLYVVTDSGEKRFLGGIYGSLLYAKVKNAVENLSEVKGFELRAVGTDGSESEPSEIAFDYDDKVSDIQVDEKKFNNIITRASTPNELSVSWTAPKNGAPDRYLLEVTICDVKSDSALGRSVFTMAASGNATSATVPVAVGGEGYRYDLKIYAIRNGEMGEATCYRGLTNDSYAQPISVNDIVLDGRQLRFVDPDTVDWYKMRVYVNDVKKADFMRGTNSGSKTNSMLTINLTEAEIQSCEVKVTLTDYAGNSSDTTAKIEAGQVVKSDNAITAMEFHDAILLNAVIQQVGDELEDLSNFKGTLDLTNLEVADLTGIELLENMSAIRLNNCTKLKNIVLVNNKQLTYIDISGCSGLKELNVNGLKLEKFDAEGTFNDLIWVDVSNNKLDLSNGTPERKFVDMAIVKASAEAVKFGGQEPIPYWSSEQLADLELKASAKEKLDLTTLIDVVTVRGSDYAKLEEETIGGVSFLADNFGEGWQPSDLVEISIVNSENNSKLEGTEIDLSKAGTYQVTFINGSNTKTITVTVIAAKSPFTGMAIIITVAVIAVVCVVAAVVSIIIIRKRKSSTNN